jgi:uncharacterized membrane protein YidH (DUF202 family)
VSHARAVLVTAALGLLGALVLMYAVARPSITRFLAGSLLLAAAAVVRYQDLHRDDPDRFGHTAQVRSLVWSVVIVVVVVGVSVLLTHPWTS